MGMYHGMIVALAVALGLSACSSSTYRHPGASPQSATVSELEALGFVRVGGAESDVCQASGDGLCKTFGMERLTGGVYLEVGISQAMLYRCSGPIAVPIADTGCEKIGLGPSIRELEAIAPDAGVLTEI